MTLILMVGRVLLSREDRKLERVAALWRRTGEVLDLGAGKQHRNSGLSDRLSR